LGSPNGLARRGWTRNSMKIGDQNYRGWLYGEGRVQSRQCKKRQTGRRPQAVCRFDGRRQPAEVTDTLVEKEINENEGDVKRFEGGVCRHFHGALLLAGAGLTGTLVGAGSGRGSEKDRRSDFQERHNRVPQGPHRRRFHGRDGRHFGRLGSRLRRLPSGRRYRQGRLRDRHAPENHRAQDDQYGRGDQQHQFQRRAERYLLDLPSRQRGPG